MKTKWLWLLIAIAGIILLFLIGYIQNGTLINLNGWRWVK